MPIGNGQLSAFLGKHLYVPFGMTVYLALMRLSLSPFPTKRLASRVSDWLLTECYSPNLGVLINLWNWTFFKDAYTLLPGFLLASSRLFPKFPFCRLVLLN